MNRLRFLAATTLIVLLTSSLALADDEKKPLTPADGWRQSLVYDLTATQSAYSNSWVGGEAGSFNWQTNLNGVAERQFTTSFNYWTQLRLSFGQTTTQDAETKDWSKPQKATDLIDWENVGRFTLHRWVDPYVAFRIETQFYTQVNEFAGTSIDQKLWLSPLKLTESAGGAHVFFERDKELVRSRLGFAMKQTIIKSVIDTDGNTESNTINDGGVESVTDVIYNLRKNLLYSGKLSLFKAFFSSESDDLKGTPQADDWKAIDVNWENQLTAKVTKIVSVSLYTQLLYDKEVVDKARFKQTLALGITIALI